MVGPLNVRALMSEVIGDLHPVPAYPPWPSRGAEGAVAISFGMVARFFLNEQPARRGRLPHSLRSLAMTAFCFRRKGGSLMLRRLTLLLLLLTTLTACDDTVNPFTGADRYFSVYGWLDPAADVQYVRVVPLRRTADVPPPGPLAATVVIDELETGRAFALRDSLVTYHDGTYGNVFIGNFQPVHGRTYRITVTRDDGVATTAETTLPPFVEVEVQPPIRTGSSVSQSVLFRGVTVEPYRVEAWYRLANPLIPTQPFQDIPLVYPAERLGGAEEGVWRVILRLTEDKEAVAEALGYDPALPVPLTLYGIGVRLTEPDDAWRPPGGVWDPEVLVQPGVFSNVDNGFGFFGSVSQPSAEWTLSEDLTRTVGYQYPR